MSKKFTLAIIVIIILIILGGIVWFTVQKNTVISPPVSTQTSSVAYTNNQYGFSVMLPQDWNGYSVVLSTWSGDSDQAQGSAEGPMISIRNPLWTTATPYQDIPVMIFTLAQWSDLQQDKFHIGAAPIGPSQLGMNSTYVFALPARYNYAYPAGWQEVDQIITSNSLTTFEPTQPPANNPTTLHIDSISPTSGGVGTQVTISGSDFTSSNTVFMDSLVAAKVSSTNGGQSISFKIPSSIAPDCKQGQACPMFLRAVTAGSYSISVENENGTSNTLNFTVTGGALLNQ